VTVTNEAGCVATDDVLVQVNIVRPVYIPNVFSPNNDGINDRFTVYAGPAADFVESLQIYSRWGELVFENSFTPNDELAGWDGTFNGQLVNPGVFTYLARVHFLDQKVVNYAGTVTVLR
jgi:gliding motility-associated-like protein